MDPIREYSGYLFTAAIGLINFLRVFPRDSSRRNGGMGTWLWVELAASALFGLAGLAALAVRVFLPETAESPLFFWSYIVLLLLLAILAAVAEKKRKSASQ